MLSAAEIARHKSPPLVAATAYDFPFARILEQAGVDIVLVGDSLANVVLGLSSTREVGMGEMILFVAAVVRGAPNTHVTADMPFGSYDTPELALRNGRRFMELGASSVKLEGTKLEAIRALADAGIPVMGHLGVLPQTALSFRRVGKSAESRIQLLLEARNLQKAGGFSMVLENMEAETAKAITESLSVPTIGIGSGGGVTGQVQVLHDLLGLSDKPPPFARSFTNLREEALRGVKAYVEAVRGGKFPG
jgi:3-methyl-2-oxobutanoate hydroxymethyltransferase